MTDVFEFHKGSVPLLVSVPHDGREVPAEIASRMTDAARRIPDTDWHVRDLYDFAAGLGASVMGATHSRYVVDLNRDPSGQALYPGASNTELVPLATFDMEPIYLDGQMPDDAEIAARTETYWRPYHQCIQDELARLKAEHGVAILFDAHSIRSEVERFFEGRLPDFNYGTSSGASADADLTRRSFAAFESAEGYSAVLNGRFTGGYITRTYGDPANGIHALQLEQSQITYMNEAYPFDYRPDLADKVKPVLAECLEALLGWAAEQ